MVHTSTWQHTYLSPPQGERLYTQERANPEVIIMLCKAARYRRATFGSSHDDAHPGNSMLHTGAFRPHLGFVKIPFFIAPYTGNHLQMFEMLPAVSRITWVCTFARVIQPYFTVGPLATGVGGGIRCSASVGWLIRDFMAHPHLGEKDYTPQAHWF